MGLEAKAFTKDGSCELKVDLSARIFDTKPRQHLLFDAVMAQRAGARQGTAKTKERSEVRGGGAKPFRQKGTGHARQGSGRSPLMPGGGRLFGPVPRDYSYRLPRKVHREAIRVALTLKRKDGRLFFMERQEMAKPKTKPMKDFLEKLKMDHVLVVDTNNVNLERSVRNLRNVKYLDVAALNVFDLMKYERLLLSTSALKPLEEKLKV